MRKALTAWVRCMITARSLDSCETRRLSFQFIQFPSTADLGWTWPRTTTSFSSWSDWRREQRPERRTEGARRILRRAEEVDLNLRRVWTATTAMATPKTAPSQAKAKCARAAATACSGVDMGARKQARASDFSTRPLSVSPSLPSNHRHSVVVLFRFQKPGSRGFYGVVRLTLNSRKGGVFGLWVCLIS